MKILLIANGEKSDIDISCFDKIICVDGGVKYLPKGVIPDMIVGDFDSVQKNKIDFFKDKSEIVYKNSQEISDLSFAVNCCLKKYKPNEIVITNAVSISRFDHSICNVLLLRKIPVSVFAKIVSRTQEFFIVRNKIEVKNLVNKTISVIPLTDCIGVSTRGLKWEINRDLQFGFINGISNVLVSDFATISVKQGELLIVLELK